jgi:hypothetical protein
LHCLVAWLQPLYLHRRASIYHPQILPSSSLNLHRRDRPARDISSQSHPSRQHSQFSSDWEYQNLFASLEARHVLLITYFLILQRVFIGFSWIFMWVTNEHDIFGIIQNFTCGHAF